MRLVFFPGAFRHEAVPAFLAETDFESDVEAYVAQLPGRGQRKDERPSADVHEIIDQLMPSLETLSNAPVVFVAHCMGTLLAYEAARRLKAKGLRGPARCLLSGAVAPHIYTAPNAHLIPDNKLLELLTVIGHDKAAEFRADKALWQQWAPLIRGDLEAMAKYRYVPGFQLDCPITVLASKYDLWSYPLQAGTWRKQTTSSEVTVEMNDGDHFFQEKTPGLMRELLKRFLAG